ncbi:MAG TPA: hypothetical protein VF257_19255 [Solirubrobacteraceae bacterium]
MIGSVRSSPRRLAVATGALAVVAIVVLDALVMDEPTPRGDDLIYEKMAQDPFATHTFPFAYRVLVPTLVHVLPLGHTFSFSLLAWLATGIAAGFMCLLLQRVGAPAPLAIGLALCLAISPPLLIVSLRQGRNVDAATVAVMVAAVLFMVQERPRALAVTLAIGALTRESAIFLIPLAYAIWTPRLWDPQTAKRVALVAAPAIAIYAALRLALPTVGREQVAGYGSLLGGRVDVLRSGLDEIGVQLRRMFTVYGPLWLFAPLALRNMRLAQRGLVLVALCVVSMTFALDWGRIILLAAPIFYAAGAFVLRGRPRASALVVASFVLLSGVYAVYMDRSGVRTGIIENSAPPYPVR